MILRAIGTLYSARWQNNTLCQKEQYTWPEGKIILCAKGTIYSARRQNDTLIMSQHEHMTIMKAIKIIHELIMYEELHTPHIKNHKSTHNAIVTTQFTKCNAEKLHSPRHFLHSMFYSNFPLMYFSMYKYLYTYQT